MSDAGLRTEPAPTCVACGGRGQVRHILRDRLHDAPGQWTIRRCVDCKSLWLDPRPTDEMFSNSYPKEYFTHQEQHAAGDAIASAHDFRGWKGWLRQHVLASCYGYRGLAESGIGDLLGRLAGQIPRIRAAAVHGQGALFPPWREGGRLLDVGCGSGVFLALMRAYGWDVVGQDVDPAAAEAADRLYHIPILSIPLGALANEVKPFDVVTAGHVLEHVVDPIGFLTAMADCLRPGGLLVVVTPNAGALGYRYFGADWFPLEVPRHVAVFSARGLKNVAGHVPTIAGRVTSQARSAHKIFDLAADVRRTGRFRGDTVKPERPDIGARAFSAAERSLSRIFPVGEELVLIARKCKFTRAASGETELPLTREHHNE